MLEEGNVSKTRAWRSMPFPQPLSKVHSAPSMQQCQPALNTQVCKVSAAAGTMNTLCMTMRVTMRGGYEVSGYSLQLPSFTSPWPETASFFGMALLTECPAHVETCCLSQHLGSLPAPFLSPAAHEKSVDVFLKGSRKKLLLQ